MTIMPTPTPNPLPPPSSSLLLIPDISSSFLSFPLPSPAHISPPPPPPLPLPHSGTSSPLDHPPSSLTVPTTENSIPLSAPSNSCDSPSAPHTFHSSSHKDESISLDTNCDRIADCNHIQPLPSQPNLYLHIEEYYRTKPPSQAQKSIRQLAQGQFRQSQQQQRSENDQEKYRLEPLQEQFTESRRKHRRSSRKSTLTKDSNSGRPSHHHQRKHTHSYPAYAQDSFDAQITPIPHRPRPLNYFSRILHRLSLLACACGSGSYLSSKHHSSVYLPRVTANTTGFKSSLSTKSSLSSFYQGQRSKARRNKHKTVSTQSSTASRKDNNTKSRGNKEARRDKGKQRAVSRSPSRSRSFLQVEVERGRQQQRVTSTLSLSTIHSWCPYCLKTVLNEDQTDHHQVHHRHNLISPTPTPQRTYSRSRSHSYSRSRPQSLGSFIQSHPVDASQSFNSVGTAQYSILSTSSTEEESTITSQLEISPVPDTLFTFNHPLPHLASTPTSVSGPTSIAILAQEEPSNPLPLNNEGGVDRRNITGELRLPISTSVHNRFSRGLETSSWVSIPSSEKGYFIIRGLPGLGRSSSTTARSGGKGAAAFPDSSNSNPKRKSWSFFSSFRNRRTSLPPTQFSSVEQDRSSLVKSQTSLVDYPRKLSSDVHKSQNHAQSQQQQQQSQRQQSKPVLTDQPEQKATAHEQSSLPVVDNTRRHQSFSEMGSNTKDHGSRNIIQVKKNSISFDQNKPLPTIKHDQYPQQQSQSQHLLQVHPEVQPQSQQQKHQRRRSFIPALMTSNLAKFVSGNHTTSPTSASTQASMQRSPRSPVAPAPLLPEMKGEDPSQVESTLLTIEQFKWAILCCGNEVKGRVTRQRSDSNQALHMPYCFAPDINVTPPSALLSQRKPEKIKGGRFNGSSSAPQAVEVAPSDAQLALKSLLQVMTLTAEEISQRTTEQRDAANAPHAPPSQMHNPSLLSLMGREGNNGVVDTSNRAKSINQSQYSASFQSLALSVNSTAPVPPSPNSTSTASTQQQLRLRSKKSQSKLVLAQATDAVLHPLSMEELVRLLVHILSVAPEQWIPWHLYDFFIRPQGRKYRDMIELLPTHSQRILRSILETIDGLVDYAVLTAMGQQQQLQQQQQQLKPFSKPRTTASTAAAAVVAALSGGNGSGMVTGENGNGASGLSSAAANGIRQQFSQAHLRSRSDATTVINKPGDELSIASLVAALTMPDSPSQVTFEPISKGDEGGEGFGEQIHQEAAVRARKRRVILDCLASLVFRPRKDMSSNLYGSDPLLNRDSKAMRQNLDPSAATDDRIKARRRYSYISGAAAIPAGPPSATIAMRMQASEKEYEAGLQAFENLVCAFEEECHPHKHSQSSHKPIRIETLVIPPALNGTTISDATGPSLSLPSSPIQVSGPNLLSALPPRQARSLTNRTASPDEVLTTVRSMSPQYSKPIPVDSLIHSRQDQQNNRIYHSIVESPTEISTGEILGAPPTPNDKPKQDPVADQKANPPREIPVTDTFNGVMSMNNNGQNIRPHSESARLRQKSEFSMSAPNFFSPPTSHVKRHRSPTILSATWSAWKGHLLVLEEEECVIGEGSDGDSQNEGGEGPQVQAGE